MARRGVSEPAKQATALQAGRRMIARGDRPANRLATNLDGRWHVDALPWVVLTSMVRRVAVDEARAGIAEGPQGMDQSEKVAAQVSNSNSTSTATDGWPGNTVNDDAHAALVGPICRTPFSIASETNFFVRLTV